MDLRLGNGFSVYEKLSIMEQILFTHPLTLEF